MKHSPDPATTFGWLVRDTFRQSIAHGIFWVLLAISLLSIGVCLSVGVKRAGHRWRRTDENLDFVSRNDPDANNAEKLKTSGVIVANGKLTLAFGAIDVPLARDTKGGVHFLRADAGRRRGRHAGAAADVDLDGRLPARLSRRAQRQRAVGQAGAALGADRRASTWACCRSCCSMP